MKRFSILWVAGAALAIWACAPNTVDDPQVGGESHFLSCGPDAACPEDATCVCGVCAAVCDEGGGCAAGSHCVASDDHCPVALCAPDPDCAEAGCAAGLTCEGGVCRAEGEFVCDGLVQSRTLDSAAELRSGLAPDVLSPSCVAGELSGPYCETETSVSYAVLTDARASVWCVPTEPVSASSLDADSVRTGAVIVLAAGDHDAHSIDPARVTIRGAHSSLTTLRGSVAIEGALVRLMGLSIDGDLDVSRVANDLVLVDVEVGGDLRAEGNRMTLIDTVVHGSTSLQGNRVTLVSTRFGAAPELPEAPDLCVDSQVMIGDEGTSVCP